MDRVGGLQVSLYASAYHRLWTFTTVHFITIYFTARTFMGNKKFQHLQFPNAAINLYTFKLFLTNYVQQ